MAYLALYREWRPKNFHEIVGQEHIVKTLLNALKQKKTAHAYLFSGPRGTGKTTAAKIFAKALNCEKLDGVEPCNLCPSCVSIDRGSAMEVFEIDAASNRGIDEIRDLRENIKLSSIQGKHKVYIIDEVHMLTTEAFNALLKTLEEPPPQVVFILATTEVQKIPLTILSRVQRFEFHRISVDIIQNRLTEVCQSLNRLVDPDALLVIAQKSEGGLRDALSILDQCLLQDDPLRVKEVYQVLGMVGEVFSSQLVDALLSSDYGKTLNFLSEGIQQGQDPRQIVRELLEYLRQMLLTSSTGKPPLVAPHIQDVLVKQCKEIGISRLLRWIGILLQGEGQLKFASNARLAAELLLVQTIYESQQSLSGQEDVTKRIETLERQIGNLKIGHKDDAGEKSNVSKIAKVISNESPPLQKAFKADEGTVKLGNVLEGSKLDVNIEGIQARWNEVLEQVKKRQKSTHAFLIAGKPVQFQGDTLTIVFGNESSFHREKVNKTENKQTIQEVLKQIFGISLTLSNLMEHEFQVKAQSVDQDMQLQEQAFINKAKDMFGADMVVVKEE